MSPNFSMALPSAYAPARGRHASGNVFLMPQDFPPPDGYLTHLEFEVDEEVWLTADDVVQGVDTVVEAALCWVENGIACPVGDTPQPVAMLEQNSPNPFNPQTTIAFEVSRGEDLVVAIYDLMGRRLRVLAEGMHASGRHEVTWNGQDTHGHAMASGTYIVRLDSESGSEARKVMLVR